MSDGVYIAEIKCGSAHVALIQRISNGNYGAVYCFDYTASNLTPGLLKKFANSWAEETLITNTDFDSRFEAYFKRNALNQGVIKLYNDNSILIFDQHSIELRESNGTTVWKTTIGA